MKSVETIIADLYGKPADAARRFDVVPSAVHNWLARGNFPPKLLGDVFADAQKKGLQLKLKDIPIRPRGVAA